MTSNRGNAKKFTFIDLFAGIGGFRLALEQFGGKCVFSSEWDLKSQDTYSKNFDEIPNGDITKIKESEIPKHDVLCAGFPCQSFSISGKRKGFEDTRGTLFFDIARIVKHHRPKLLFLENVKNLARHNNGKTLEVIKNTLNELKYDIFIEVLRSSDYGVPQARERIYFVAFRRDLKRGDFKFPISSKVTKTVRDILEDEPVEPSLYINRSDIEMYKSDAKSLNPRKPLQIGKINKGGQGERVYSIDAAGITLSAYGGGVASKTGAYLVDGKIRKLTPRESARMQGFPETYKLPSQRNRAYKQFGDSVSVPVLSSIFSEVLRTLPELRKEILRQVPKKVIKLTRLNLEQPNE
jgi:DNA (cytosine-5)-methyltransferase 1